MVSPNVLVSIMAMCASRRVRAALGFSYDHCIQMRIPPCRLCIDPPFLRRLGFLMEHHLPNKSVVVYHASTVPQHNISVQLRFDEDTCSLCMIIYVGLELHSEQHTPVACASQVICGQEDVLWWHLHANSETRCYWIGVHNDCASMHDFSTTYEEAFSVPASFDACVDAGVDGCVDAPCEKGGGWYKMRLLLI